MKQIILGIVVLVVLIGGYIFYQSENADRTTTSAAYYQELTQECEQKDNKSCCMASVKRMEETGSYKVSVNGICDYGYKKEMMRCVDSFTWCEAMTINDTSKAGFYQGLRDNCENNRFKECCLDSVKAMEVVGAKSFPDVKHGKKYGYEPVCKSGLKKMVLRCPGSYTWCQTYNDFDDDEDFVPVPVELPTINPGPGYDNDGNGSTCTQEAKSCGDGTFVGRTGPSCEFAKCPGKKLNPDFVPTKDNPIELPDNVISEKDCIAAGGEVWNTLGETSYDGELIGKVEGLKCPCACLIRNKKPDVLWINKNGNKEEFTGNLDDIKTFDDCEKAGFKILNTNPKTCVVGEPHMTGGKYITFTNNPMEAKKTCSDYTYSNCPGSCVAKCTSSSCGEPWIEDGEEMTACTSDCDGVGSCVVR